MIGRSGDHLITHFQCDLCQLSKIQGGDPNPQGGEDMRLMVATIRAALDIFWIREPGTVRGYLTMLKKLMKVAR